MLNDDFLQYWLGAYVHLDAATGDEATVNAPTLFNAGDPFGTTPFDAQRRRQRRQPGPRVLDGHHVERPAPGQVPAVQVSGGDGHFDRPPPFDPPTGTYYMVAAQRRGAGSG